jgi:hypothetical protein
MLVEKIWFSIGPQVDLSVIAFRMRDSYITFSL